MVLTYIYHSGFAIEAENCSILIDYYRDSDGESSGIVHDRILKKELPLYVLITHSHHDHYNPEVFKWRLSHPNITYICAKEILDSKNPALKDIFYLDKLEEYKDDIISIKAFGSTDIGISYLIETAGKVLFHAGDLNDWHWNEESNEDEIREAETYYHSELKLLSAQVSHINLAMFPVDARLGKDYMKGAEEFVKAIKTDIFAPMHFSENGYKSAAAFAPIAKANGAESICWTHAGESIEF